MRFPFTELASTVLSTYVMLITSYTAMLVVDVLPGTQRWFLSLSQTLICLLCDKCIRSSFGAGGFLCIHFFLLA